MGFKDVTKPANISGMQQAIDGVGDENEGHHNPNDIEAAARIMYRTVQPVFVHIESLRRCLPHSGSWAMILLQCAMVTVPTRTAFQPRRPSAQQTFEGNY